MFDKIERTNPLFKIPSFLKDGIAFNVMISIVENQEKYPTPRIYSNHQNCLIVNSSADFPVIVWADDTFCAYEELYSFLIKEFSNNSPLRFMSKFDFYDFLKNKGVISCEDFQLLGAYTCSKLNEIEYVGKPDFIKESEVDLIIKMLEEFIEETGIEKPKSSEVYLLEAREFLNNPLYQVWRDTNDKIVAIALFQETEVYGRISKVMTLKEARGHSYAKMLVHFMTKRILERQKIPMLFTNFNYEASNKCYQKVGYELQCKVINYAA